MHIMTPYTSSVVAQRLLANADYDTEFQGYLSNHAKHAVIALDKLKASDQRIQEYWDNYTHETPYHLSLHRLPPNEYESAQATTQQEWKNLRGQKQKWLEMVKMLDQEQEDNGTSTTEFVQAYAPELLTGLAGALTHGIIHLGWAMDANSPWMIKEGLAYLNFCYLPVGPPLVSNFFLDEPSPLDSLTRITTEWHRDDLATTWIEKSKQKYDDSFHPELVPAGFQWQLAKFLKEAHPMATHMPTWLQTKPLDEVWEALYRTVTLLYLATRDLDPSNDKEKHGNFVVLHFLSSLWGLEQVCRVLSDETVVRAALEQYWAVGICLLATTGKVPTTSDLNAIAQDYSDAKVDQKDFSWEKLVARGIAEEEEHNIKLVYMTKELWNRYGRWSGFSEAENSFTLTPNIGPSSSSFQQA